MAATRRISMVVAVAAMKFSSIRVVLSALILKGYKFTEFTSKGGVKMKVNVTNMTCGHCEMTIRKALNDNGFDDVKIDLTTKMVEVDLKDKSEKEVIEIIKSKGYDVAI